jgi:hypothetical protein
MEATDTTTVGLELDQLRAMGRSGRATALRAIHRRAADARTAVNRRRLWENAGPVATLDADAQAQALQVLYLRSGGSGPAYGGAEASDVARRAAALGA